MVSGSWKVQAVATVLLLSTSLALVQRCDQLCDRSRLIDGETVGSDKRQSVLLEDCVERDWRRTGREDVTRDRLLRAEWHSERKSAVERRTRVDESGTKSDNVRMLDENRDENSRISNDDYRERYRSLYNGIRLKDSGDRDLDSVEREYREDLKRNQAYDLTHRDQARREHTRHLVHREEAQSRNQYETLDERRERVLDQRRDNRRDASRQQNDREYVRQRISRDGSDRRQTQVDQEELPSDRIEHLEDSFQRQYREDTRQFIKRSETAQTDRRKDSQDRSLKQMDVRTQRTIREESMRSMAREGRERSTELNAPRGERLREDDRTARYDLQSEDSRERSSRVNRNRSTSERRQFQLRETTPSDKAEEHNLKNHRIVVSREHYFTRSDKGNKLNQLDEHMQQDRLFRSRRDSNLHSSEDTAERRQDFRNSANNDQINAAKRSSNSERNERNSKFEDTLDWNSNREEGETDRTDLRAREDLHRAVDREVVRKEIQDRIMSSADRREDVRNQREPLERSRIPAERKVRVKLMASQENFIRESIRIRDPHNLPDEQRHVSRLRLAGSETHIPEKQCNDENCDIFIHDCHREESRINTESIDRRMTKRTTEHRERQIDDSLDYTQGVTKYTKLSLLTIQGTLLTIILMKTTAFDNIKTQNGLLFKAMDFVGITQM